jgi:hypothetical protein
LSESNFFIRFDNFDNFLHVLSENISNREIFRIDDSKLALVLYNINFYKHPVYKHSNNEPPPCLLANLIPEALEQGQTFVWVLDDPAPKLQASNILAPEEITLEKHVQLVPLKLVEGLRG